LASWRKHLPQLLNVHRVNEVRQTELHTREPLLPELSAFHIQLAIDVHRVNKVRQTELHTTETLQPELSAFHVQVAIECTQG
jgi:hypothetical protein